MEKDAREADSTIDGSARRSGGGIGCISIGQSYDDATADAAAGGEGGGGGDSSSLESMQAQFSTLEGSERQLQAAHEDAQRRVVQLTAQRGGLALVRRIFDARQRLDEHKAKLAEGEAFVAAKLNDFSAASGHSSKAGAGALMDMARETAEEMGHLREAKARCEGELSQISTDVQRLTRELEGREFVGLEKRQHASLVEITVMEMAAKDLDRYYTAIDTALQRYHKIKIDEINLTLRSLWASTYQGEETACPVPCVPPVVSCFASSILFLLPPPVVARRGHRHD
jgi:hypothetical protein